MNKKQSMAIDFQDNMILLTRKYLKRKIMCPETKFRHHVKERMHVLELLKRTVDMGESNSALLIGPRGSGKTTLINSVLKELSSIKSFKENALIVNLHGLVHTDDRLALKDATRQMQLENVVGDKVFGTFAENLSFLLECLKSGDKKRSKPVIFILDEFDLFCEHHNQTLLYNLFDIAQSAQAPICVIGMTCRLDVIELLEKRVKSRFSHRQIFLFPGDTSSAEQPTSPFDDRLELFQHLLSLPDDENVNRIEQQYDDCTIDPQFGSMWNDYIKSLVTNATMVNLLKRMYQMDVSERSFRNFLAVAVSTLSEKHQRLEVNDFVEASKIFTQDDKVLMLEGLSVLEICLVIAMKHETEIYDGEPLNFEAVYNRYNKFATQHSSIQSVQRPVIMKAFEHIKNLEILMPTSGINSKVEKEYQYYKFLLTSQQVMDAVKNYPGIPTEVSQWALSTM
ncbi:origin recognition complex subunit 4 [Megalopta genalis]|uniref:origin recognition complex subunit 4 n=1 Tax=Megalopta genalis TaxID=115081 RepID=UPI0014433D51|nr:origin recognition complex subunit 4 [Megalopta genalis]XP_033336286.1 origin recognition complex subunit 4 [Megalopta genalis]XP_033336287.1 origin recognition complex subunit 4 [Megalopta genalis]XP_033336288.1 origin recognition complex subunit 4 [Megalopta genalis]XP_033336289.1 origin recognition complex subunit 4 [Megalopta genalis]